MPTPPTEMLDCQQTDDQLAGEASTLSPITPQPPPLPATTKKRPERRKFIGFKEHLELARVRQESNRKVGQGDPWLTRKFAVGLVIAIFFYSYYVFVVRISIPMIQLHPNRRGNRTQGIIYLIFYHLLFLLFIWSYTVAITTPPGFAEDYVEKTDPPKEDAELVQVVGYKFEDQPSALPTQMVERRESDEERGTNGTTVVEEEEEATSKEKEEITTHPFPTHNPTTFISPSFEAPTLSASTHTHTQTLSTSSRSPVLPQPPAPARLSTSSQHSYLNFPPPPADVEPAQNGGFEVNRTRKKEFGEEKRGKSGRKLDRIPLTGSNPVLREDWRYDSRVGILRPYRSHRCKHCAKVVLKMDHHCPWVGTCVGARNYKYFYNFLSISSLYTLLVTLTSIISLTHTPIHLDGQIIAIIILSGFFTFFTLSLFLAHTRLLLLNLTTIEDLAVSRLKAREREVLRREFGTVGAVFGSGKVVRKRWDWEWGRVGMEGNLWWKGSKAENWKMVMGERKWGWFLPIPAYPKGDDGLSYVPNPRFSKEGIWSMREEWPEELR